jgi:D-alanine-D-alanine ligase
MKHLTIGFTYDLKQDYLAEGFSAEEAAEFDAPETISGIEAALQAAGHAVERIGNVRRLVSRLAAGERWDLVFNIAEGVSGVAREAQVPAVLDAYGIPYTFSDPMVLALALHKGMTKHVIRDNGIPTAPFAVVNEPEEIASVRLPFPLFVKPAAEGTGKGIGTASKVHSERELEERCRELLLRYSQPVLVETYLPGREYTVGVLGTGRAARVIGVMEILYESAAEGEIYSYSNKANYEGRISYRLTDDEGGRRAGDAALAAWRALGCRDGGRLDIREDEHGVPCFIEVNPLAGLNPVISDLPILSRMAGLSYDELIRGILESALARTGAGNGVKTAV